MMGIPTSGVSNKSFSGLGSEQAVRRERVRPRLAPAVPLQVRPPLLEGLHSEQSVEANGQGGRLPRGIEAVRRDLPERKSGLGDQPEGPPGQGEDSGGRARDVCSVAAAVVKGRRAHAAAAGIAAPRQE